MNLEHSPNAPDYRADFEKPIKWLFGIGNGIVWTAFCVRLFLHWRAMSSLSHWTGVALAFAFASLWYSLIRDKDKASRLLAATGAFLVTMIAVYRVF